MMTALFSNPVKNIYLGEICFLGIDLAFGAVCDVLYGKLLVWGNNMQSLDLLGYYQDKKNVVRILSI